FYRLDRAQLLALDGYGQVSVENLLRSIEASKERPFGIVLFAIGIEGVGYVTGRNVAARFRSIDALLAATPEQLAATPGLGLLEHPSGELGRGAGLDAVGGGVLARGEGLGELAAGEVQRGVVVGGVARRERALVDQPAIERPPLRLAVVMRAGRALQEAQP